MQVLNDYRKFRVQTGQFGTFITVAKDKKSALRNAAIQYAEKMRLSKSAYGIIIKKFTDAQPLIKIMESRLTQRDLLLEFTWDQIVGVGQTFAPKLFNPIQNTTNFFRRLAPDKFGYRGEKFTIQEIGRKARIFKQSRFWKKHNIHGMWTPNLLRYFMSDYLQINYPMSREDTKNLKMQKMTDKVVRKFLESKGIIS